MRIGSKLSGVCVRALTESMDTRTMCILAKKIIPNYDIHKRTGYPESLAIPNKQVARQIVEDAAALDLFPNLVKELIDIQESGHMGRKYSIAYLNTIINGVYDLGYIYDKENAIFVENPRYRITRNWGTLQPGDERTLAFLRIDIVGNSELVRNHPAEVVKSTYEDLRLIVQQASRKRNGRLWSWEGDGGLAAFIFSNKHLLATLAAMEVLHSLFLYNRTDCGLTSPLQVRMAVHSGLFEYTENEEDLIKSDTVKQVVQIESSHTPPDSVSISPVVKVMLDEIISRKFQPQTARGQSKYFTYSIRWEQT